MEEEPVNFIRESTRDYVKSHRRDQRDEETDVRRCMENMRLTGSVADIASRLKTKSSVSVAELQTLKSGLLDDPKNIEVVLGVHGALRGLVRELTGHEVKKQCLAADCLCNLALGDSRAVLTVTKAAGPYLVAALDSLTEELSVSCAWAVGNLLGSGARASALLSGLGATGRLSALAARASGDARDAALHALLHLVYQMRDDLGLEHFLQILEVISQVDCSMTSAHLLFALSCHEAFNSDRFNIIFLRKLLQDLSVSIKKHLTLCPKTKNCCELLYLIRALANLGLDDFVFSVVVNFFIQNTLEDSFREVLSKDSEVKESLLWLLGNLYNYNSDNVFFSNLLK